MQLSGSITILVFCLFSVHANWFLKKGGGGEQKKTQKPRSTGKWLRRVSSSRTQLSFKQNCFVITLMYPYWARMPIFISSVIDSLLFQLWHSPLCLTHSRIDPISSHYFASEITTDWSMLVYKCCERWSNSSGYSYLLFKVNVFPVEKHNWAMKLLCLWKSSCLPVQN